MPEVHRVLCDLRAGEPPPGARAVDVAAVGALLVTLGRSAGGLRAVLTAVRSWLGRGGEAPRTVRLEMAGGVLEPSSWVWFT